MSLTPGWGSSDATSLTDKKPKKRNRSNVTNSVKTLKMVLFHHPPQKKYLVKSLGNALISRGGSGWVLFSSGKNKASLV